LDRTVQADQRRAGLKPSPWSTVRHIVAEFDTMADKLLLRRHPVELGDNRAGALSRFRPGG
jgi:hypothetical protein